VGFFPVDEMVVEIEWLIRSNRDSIFRMATTEILVNVSGVVIDDDDYATGLDRIGCVAGRAGLFQKPTKP
jgi:hypothetical protein